MAKSAPYSEERRCLDCAAKLAGRYSVRCKKCAPIARGNARKGKPNNSQKMLEQQIIHGPTMGGHGIRDCQQPTSDRAAECSGMFLAVTPIQRICELCENAGRYTNRTIQFVRDSAFERMHY